MSILNEVQKNQYQQDGFLILPDFISIDMCELLKTRAIEIILKTDTASIKTVFSTTGQTHTKHHYFLESGDKIRCFFEENAFNAAGELIKDKLYSINKIGHALHDLDPIFNCFSRSHKIASLIEDLQIPNPLLLQSMYICKQPFIGAEVNCHQDSTFLYVKDYPVIGLWFALEDATLENGCLWAIPGGHQLGLKSRSLKDKNNQITQVIYDTSPWPLEKMIPLEVPRGSLILLHGLLPHMSKENTSSVSRHAYTLHVISGEHEYAEDNWLQRSKDMPMRGFL